MRSSFFEFHVALTGMTTARAGTRTAAHNMANLTTEVFSRQHTIQQASHPLSTHNRTGMVGTGSEVTGIGQTRNHHLDIRFWNERPSLGRQSMIGSQLTLMERRFNELQENSFTSNFDLFFDAMQDLHTDPADATFRNAFIQSIVSKSRNLQSQAAGLMQQQQDVNREIGNMVTVINSIGDRVANLNRQIQRYELHGDRANDLRDQRAVLLDELSLLVNINVNKVVINDREVVMVHIDGQEFINDDIVTRLATERRTTLTQPTDAGGLYDIVFVTDRGRTFPFNQNSSTLSGELKGLLDIRDGNSQRHPAGHPNAGETVGDIDFRGIPYYFARLNHMISTFANAFNYGVDAKGEFIPGVTGHTMNTDGTPRQGGIPLFVSNERAVDNNGNYIWEQMQDFDGNGIYAYNPVTNLYDIPVMGYRMTPINIWNFSINPDILADQSLLRTAKDPDNGESDNSLLHGFFEIRNTRSLFREGTLNDFINSVTAELAMDLRDAQAFEDSQTLVLRVVQNQRLEIKGVDMDEEMTSLILLQQHFNAAAQLITVINEIYDNMINRMGA